MKSIIIYFKKYCIYIVSIVIIFFIIIHPGYDNVEDYFLKNYKSASEILYQNSYSEDHYIIFFLNNDGWIYCALIKKEFTGYRLIRTSGRFTISDSPYLYSFFLDNDENYWINWKIIIDKKIKSIWTEYGKMNLVECKPYNYRICWMIGKGKAPQVHNEKTSDK